MNWDQVKGNIDDAAGRVKRKVGEWTGDTESEVKGAAQQVKGKAEKAAGNVRDAVNDARKDRDVSDADRIRRDRYIESNLDDDDDINRESVREHESFHDRE
jgi:uncharacterized protein YjbJ (UPF0337 family)